VTQMVLNPYSDKMTPLVWWRV